MQTEGGEKLKSNGDIELRYPNKDPTPNVIANTPAASLRRLKVYGDWSGNGWLNTLVHGNNLTVLKTFLGDPDVRGNVELIYIDPPFATGRTFDQEDDMTRYNGRVYEDTLIGAEYLEFLRKRLILLRELLSETGSIYVHLDQKMAHYGKVLMDEIFGRRNFRNWITRKKCHPKGYTKNSYGNIQDFILFYTKNDDYVWNTPLSKLTPEKVRSSEYRYSEEGTGRIYKRVPLHAPGTRRGKTGEPWRGRMPPPGKHWQYRPEKLEQLDQSGKVYWSPTGNPRLKVYLDEREGMLVQDIWLDFLDPMNQHTSLTGFPTEKNQAMLELIVKTSSNPGDIVLDCFVGSGTTLAIAEILDRRWLGIDASKVAIETTVERLIKSGTTSKLVHQPFCVSDAVR